jgi:hypothetical protein
LLKLEALTMGPNPSRQLREHLEENIKPSYPFVKLVKLALAHAVAALWLRHGHKGAFLFSNRQRQAA